ncbi:P-loop containing nucleoside triphosphate hydrolase protein [Polychytrium aggregatum]|uniref:P-loop containing nucleoside triphosphate hydrolase protein n=1 Tax=Polychytrium aggregatum TaxID=110093 RepID=UPI0022FE187F|nr:P-loop containing nucleoside triphosphate hydrolase protein [Polychytrium aggregatum]KAI9202184.1 P-loop containing nucleoside triphosphate hydrolase protein [Polychytrium aggregatum]
MSHNKKGNTSLGKSLIRSRFSKNPNAKINPDGSLRHTTLVEDDDLTNMQSITEENDLEAFLNSATLAGTNFAAERLNVTVVSDPYVNPFLLTPEKEKETLRRHLEHQKRLTIPRRPEWDSTTTGEELKLAERESFLEWRRGLVELEEEQGLILTPYERNLEVWRQLWRVIERSDLIVQIVDARNPLFFRSTDLETYVGEVDDRKKRLLLVNKADMLTLNQRTLWADFFEKEGIRYTFFSAAMARQQHERELEEQKAAELEKRMKKDRTLKTARKQNLFELMGNFKDEDMVDGEGDSDDEEDDEAVEAEDEAEDEAGGEDAQEDGDASPEADEPYQEAAQSPEEPGGDRDEDVVEIYAERDESLPERVRILSADDLLELLERECPEPLNTEHGNKVTIGFVGYPNVGKSSTLNALVGAKKVAVAATPGKTKHFQTIHLSDSMILCDCPGLVFPTFATTKADMVLNGVLPIDQLREHTGPAGLLTQRIPKVALEGIYGLRIRTRDAEGLEIDRAPTGEELLSAYAIARGFKKSYQGNPDEARASRYVFKDYVNGKLLYCHPPPGNNDAKHFNAEIYLQERFQRKTIATPGYVDGTPVSQAPSRTMDSEFFNSKHIQAKTVGKFSRGNFNRNQMFPHQNRVDDVGEEKRAPLKGKGRRAPRGAVTAEALIGNSVKNDKRHKKGPKNVKMRTQWTVDE